MPPDVVRVYNMLTPKPKELVLNALTRKFIREGEIRVYNNKEKKAKPRHLFLFNDCVLIAKREGKTKYWLKVYITLSPTIRIEDVRDTATAEKVEFRIYAPRKNFILFARTKGEKESWIQDLKDTISQTTSRGNTEEPMMNYGREDSHSSAEYTSTSVTADPAPPQKERDFMIAPSKPRATSVEQSHQVHQEPTYESSDSFDAAFVPVHLPSSQESSYVPFRASEPLPFVPLAAGVSILQPISLVDSQA